MSGSIFCLPKSVQVKLGMLWARTKHEATPRAQVNLEELLQQSLEHGSSLQVSSQEQEIPANCVKTRVCRDWKALCLLRTGREMMLLLSKKKGPVAHEYQQHGAPWPTHEQAGAGDTDVLRIQRMKHAQISRQLENGFAKVYVMECK